METYDEYELLMLSKGRCAQDDYYLEPLAEKDLPDQAPSAEVGAEKYTLLEK